jgi:subtilisin family serine protease
MLNEMQTSLINKPRSLISILVIYAFAFIIAFSLPTSKALSKSYMGNFPDDVFQPEVRAAITGLQADEKISVIVTLKQQASLSNISASRNGAPLQAVIQALQDTAGRSQIEVLSLLNDYQLTGQVDEIIPFWIFNGFSITTTAGVIAKLASHPDVLSIRSDRVDLIPSAVISGVAIQDNLALINAPRLWEQGWMGQGVVVASMDTGVDLTHPDLTEKWRGGSNSWYDPFAKHEMPTDLNGHGTMTMGVILGGESSGTAIGVAPYAEWISVKIFDDDGSSSATAVHLGFQWLLDPDNDPSTDDAPDVVNNSWSFANPGCNTEFQMDLQALRAAGILPVFSAGNFGPNADSSVSPANYPEAFAVGAVTNEDLILALSSRGPSACAEEEKIYPDIIAPGYKIFTSDLYGFFTTATGTSLAAPHVTGSLALLLSAFPTLTIENQEIALIENAVDLGEFGPDNIYGNGRIDVGRSFQAIYESGIYPMGTPIPLGDHFQYYLPAIWR